MRDVNRKNLHLDLEKWKAFRGGKTQLSGFKDYLV